MSIIKNHTNPTVCPVCGATHQESYDYEIDAPTYIAYFYRCTECSAEWDEVYEFKPMYINLI